MSIAPLGRTKNIHWTITSKIDPRWNGSGKSGGFISLSPHEASKHLRNCRKKYGKKPKDLMYEAYRE